MFGDVIYDDRKRAQIHNFADIIARITEGDLDCDWERDQLQNCSKVNE